MRVEIHEYGDDPEAEYPEDFNSFKVMSIRSEPDIRVENDSIPLETEDLEEKDSAEHSKRLLTAVEFDSSRGGYIFVEKPVPTPGWLKKAFDLLREEGWQGYGFREFRVGCREDIEIVTTEDFTAVIDREKEKVYHNKDSPIGSGDITSLKDWKV